MTQLSLRNLKQHFVTKQLSPLEVTKNYLRRIETHVDLNAFITVTPEVALEQAMIAERKYQANEIVGAMEGIPISYKDNLYTKGIRTTNGSQVDECFVPDIDAGIVHRLTKEGAINLGKANMHEYAFGITSNNPHYGAVKNPWHPEFTSGGSSGGSGAAVAASLCAASIGTDTAGSIRIPAASCGVVGLKPTHNLVDVSHLTHISWTLDHVGPLTKTVDDAVFMLNAMTGTNFDDALNEDIRGLRIGVPATYFNESIDPEVEELYKEALHNFEKLGAILIEVPIPFHSEDLALSFAIGIAEAGYIHEKVISHSLHKLGVDVKASLENSHQIRAIDYIKALDRRQELTRQFEALFKTVDVIVTPTIPTTAQKIGQELITIQQVEDTTFNTMIRLPAVFNQTGQPSLSIPCGLASNGLPVGLQLSGALYNELAILHAGYAYEQQYLQSFYKQRENRLHV